MRPGRGILEPGWPGWSCWTVHEKSRQNEGYLNISVNKRNYEYTVYYEWVPQIEYLLEVRADRSIFALKLLAPKWRPKMTQDGVWMISWHQKGMKPAPLIPRLLGITSALAECFSLFSASHTGPHLRNKKIRPSWIAKPDFLRPKGLIVNFAYLKSSFRAIAATDQLQSLKLRGRSSCWSFWSQAQRWSWWSVGQENVQCTWAKKGQNIPKHLISNMDQYIVSIKMDAPNI